MKLKLFHSFLLTFLFTSLLATLTLFAFSCYDIAFNTEKVSDSIIFIICFLFIVVLNVLHLANTFISFKKGSAFMCGIVYNEYKKINVRGLVICGIALALGLAGFIYAFVIMFKHDIFLGATPAPLKLMIISMTFLMMGDMIFTLIYPTVGQLDSSYKKL